MAPKKQPKKKSNKDGKKKKKEKEPEPIVEMIDVEEQLKKGGNVPALINHASEETKTLAKELVIAWKLKGSQAWWRMGGAHWAWRFASSTYPTFGALPKKPCTQGVRKKIGA